MRRPPSTVLAASLLVLLAAPRAAAVGGTAHAVAAAAPVAVAAPAASPAVDRALIPIHARWLAHLDLSALLGSRLLAELRVIEPDLDLALNPDLAELRSQLGFDPTREIHAITAVGLPRDEEAAVILVHTTAAIESAYSFLEQHLSHGTAQVGGVTVRTWEEQDGGETIYTYLARKAGSDARLLLVAPDTHDLATGLAAMRGEIETLADEPGALPLPEGQGQLVTVVASGSLAELADDGEALRIARMIQSASLSVTEHGGRLAVDVAVTTAAAADASMIQQTAQGGLAFIQLMARNDPDAAPFLELLQRLTIQVRGSTLVLHFEDDVTALIELARRLDDHDDVDLDIEVGSEVEPSPPARPGKPDGWH